MRRKNRPRRRSSADSNGERSLGNPESGERKLLHSRDTITQQGHLVAAEWIEHSHQHTHERYATVAFGSDRSGAFPVKQRQPGR